MRNPLAKKLKELALANKTTPAQLREASKVSLCQLLNVRPESVSDNYINNIKTAVAGELERELELQAFETLWNKLSLIEQQWLIKNGSFLDGWQAELKSGKP